MRFDDRLTTVLEHPASTAHDRAVRWRQLVELVARASPQADRDLVSRALETIRDERDQVDERVRVSSAVAVTPLLLPVELVAAFAADRLAVAAPVLAAARLTASEWREVADAASEECRGFITAIRSEPAASPQPHQAREEGASIPSIGEVVARIERLRQSRDESSPASAVSQSRSPRLFRWECNESGEIDWVEGAPRGALVGQSIAQGGSGHGVSRAVERAFASRASFHDGAIEIPGDSAIGGRWKLSGIPAFDPGSGRFSGYRGVAERPPEGDEGDGPAATADPNAVRELAHEIRTPLNAIIGFAEIITGEYLGPAEGRFRERAAEIVAQARLLVEAIDDLDFAARLNALPADKRAHVHLGELVERMVPGLRDFAAGRNVTIDAPRATGDLSVAIEPELAERLILRMCAAVIECAAGGERLSLAADRSGRECRVSISRPASLQAACDEAVFGTGETALGGGFSLRLVRGLANVAGAALVASANSIALALPCSRLGEGQ